ncbi:MAG: hypothetical protein GC201_18460 [Alphaproteobacteria bacterium]|nr:hypothetical protein [Alphaproteobacteria bacterium]
MAGGGTMEARVGALGAQGDGIAETPEGRLFVPFTVPGDRVRVRPGQRRGEGRAASLIEVVESGPGRADPSCPHFGACGGCALQHLAAAPYAAFKREQVVRALGHHGLGEVPVGEPLIVPAGARRRTALSAKRAGGRLLLGYQERASHRLVDVSHCPVIVPQLERLLAPLRDLLGGVLAPGGAARVSLTATATGVDVILTADEPPDLAARERLAAFAEAHDLARIGVESAAGYEPVAARRTPMVAFDGVQVPLPPGAFLQATEASEAWMIGAARRAVAEATRIADLFAGCGTFTAALARDAEVWSYEADAAMLEACRQGLNRASGRRPVTPVRRDLFRDPLTADELAAFEAVVIDPPRAGARAQSEQLARSAVPVVAAFSCNPGTFARDGRILVDGGYRLEGVTPVDQFRWSAHTELAAIFRKG